MKRIIILTFIALSSVSCVIDNGESNNWRTNERLLKYSENLLNTSVITPVKQLNYLLVLDTYLKLTEEEQNGADWEEFRGQIEQVKENILRIADRNLIVDTKGVQLTVPGNFWTISNISQSHYQGGYIWAGEESGTWLNSKKIHCTETDKYEITYTEKVEENIRLNIEAIQSSTGGYDFSVNGNGKTKETEDGIHSEYEVFDFYYERHRKAEDGTGNSAVSISYSIESFKFDVHIFKNAEELDWCKLSKEESGLMTYDCSIAPEPDRFYFE